MAGTGGAVLTPMPASIWFAREGPQDARPPSDPSCATVCTMLAWGRRAVNTGGATPIARNAMPRPSRAARTVDIDALRNLRAEDVEPRFHPGYGRALGRLPSGHQVFRGLPFDF